MELLGLAWPLPEGIGRLSSSFGPRTIKGKAGVHGAWDLGCPDGTEVRAAADGVVVYAHFDDTGGGCTVAVRHEEGFRTEYAHLSAIDVALGEEVHVGQPIALSGHTGRAFGPHLHFAIRVSGEWIRAHATALGIEPGWSGYVRSAGGGYVVNPALFVPRPPAAGISGYVPPLVDCIARGEALSEWADELAAAGALAGERRWCSSAEGGGRGWGSLAVVGLALYALSK